MIGMSVPSGFNPEASLLPPNPSATIVPFRGGGTSLGPFYQALLKKLPEEKRRTLPQNIKITDFVISEEDGKFVLKLKVEGITVGEKEAEEEILKKAREFLILEAARAFLRKQIVTDSPNLTGRSTSTQIEQQYNNLSGLTKGATLESVLSNTTPAAIQAKQKKEEENATREAKTENPFGFKQPEGLVRGQIEKTKKKKTRKPLSFNTTKTKSERKTENRGNVLEEVRKQANSLTKNVTLTESEENSSNNETITKANEIIAKDDFNKNIKNAGTSIVTRRATVLKLKQKINAMRNSNTKKELQNKLKAKRDEWNIV
jgi:hypothetical protein